MKAREFFRRIFDKAASAVFPEDVTCDVCGEELVANTRFRLCAECLEKLPLIKGHICLSCGAPIKDESDYCIRCQNMESAFERSRSPLVYDGEAKALVYTMKFGGKPYIAKTLGAFMADCFVQNGMRADVIVFVPMTKEEEKRRGFNQAELLARDLGDRVKLPVLPALEKVKDTSSQKELNREERAKNLEGAFKCTLKEVKLLNVLLVDDVFTTGITANECAKALLKGKAKSVSVLTAAVTVLKPRGETAQGSRKQEEKEKRKENPQKDNFIIVD